MKEELEQMNAAVVEQEQAENIRKRIRDRFENLLYNMPMVWGYSILKRLTAPELLEMEAALEMMMQLKGVADDRADNE